MSEWWTYTLSDFLMFSPRTYYRLTELYNQDIWPAQWVALALGVAVVGRWLRSGKTHGRAIAAVLAVLWLWVAWAYFYVRYDTINWAAAYAAIAFAAEAGLLAWIGVVRGGLAAPAAAAAGRLGAALAAFAIVVFPLIAPLAGRPWTHAEIFGVMPDPTAIATLGIVAGSARPSWPLLVVPLLWCAISAATLWTMGSPDAVVPIGALAGAAIAAAWRRPRAVNTDRPPR